MNRTIVLMLALMLSTALSAAPHHKVRPRHHRSTPIRTTKAHPIIDTINCVPWQFVLAGGAATSGIVFAYKVSDGIQQGTIETAQSKPEAFIDKTGISGTAQMACAACLLIAIGYLVWRIGYRSRWPAASDTDNKPSS